MKLLICTQKVDRSDDILGFFHRWIEEFAKHCEQVSVVCLWEGTHEFPENVRVYSLGKSAQGRPASGWERLWLRIRYALRLYGYTWRLRNEYDSVFVHMNPEYVVLGGPLWRVLGKKVVLWYTHREVNFKLRLAVLFADAVVTAAPESLRIESKKISIVGHGIDTAHFAALPLRPPSLLEPRIVSVGRITPIKNLEVIIDAVSLLRARGVQATLDLIGLPTLKSDFAYERQLHNLVARLKAVSFVSFLGSIPNTQMGEYYPRYDVAINACPTGGIDKAVLESMAAGVLTFVSNQVFRRYFADYADSLLFAYRNAEDLAQKIQAALMRKDVGALQAQLRASAKKQGDVSEVVPRILKVLL